MSKGLPDDVRKFILAHVDSHLQLEVLLALRERPNVPSTVMEVANEHRITVDMARSILQHLAARGFIQRRDDDDDDDDGNVYVFEPKTGASANRLQAVAEAYRTYRVAIMHLIYSKPAEGVRGFADAFRLRRDDSDG